MLVKDLLEFKSSDKVASVLSQSTVAGAAKQMLNFNIGFVLVLENSQLVGVLSERDIGSTPYFSDTSYLNRLHKFFLTM
jgi:CBS domain-containing protein